MRLNFAFFSNFSVQMSDTSHLRRIVIVRHAERVDFTFGSWIPACFDDKGNYIRRNINMPKSVPKRTGGPMDFFKDSPLTRIGLFQASLTGEAMNACNMKFDHVFCSPSLRCVETCTNALEALNQTHLKLNIEPGLFEWCGWYKNGMPTWMNLSQLSHCGFNVSQDYKPVINALALNTSETSEEYYMRSFLVASKLIASYSGNLFFVGHAATLDTCTRQLTGRAPRNEKELQLLVQKIPYCSVSIMEEQDDRKWQLVDPPFPSLKHCDNLGFDWHVLLN